MTAPQLRETTMFNRKERKRRLKRVYPFITYLLRMVEMDKHETQDKVQFSVKDPCENSDCNKYVFKVASVYSFFQAKFVDHVFIRIDGKLNKYKRLDKCIMDLNEDDILFMEKLLISWI